MNSPKMRRLSLPVCLLGALIPACGDSDGSREKDFGGLVHAEDDAPKPIDVEAAAKEPDELLRALKLPHRKVGELLGPHRFQGSSELRVLEGDEAVSELETETSIHLDADGGFHAVLENSEDYGRDVYFVDGTLYLRPRYGAYHRRPPKEGEPAGIRDQVYGTLGAHFELLAPGAEVSDAGALEVAGRNGRKIEIGQAPEPGEPPAQELDQRKWREDTVVRAVSGSVVLDRETGAPLRASLEGAVGYRRDGRSFEMRLEVKHEIAAVGDVDAVEAPPAEETMATPERATELEERSKLLEGIAPPPQQAPTPESVESGEN